MSILNSHHIAMKTPDFRRAKTFYTETLGFPIAGKLGDNIVFIDIGGTTIELMATGDMPPEQRPACGLMHLAFECDDVDATYGDLAAKGVEFHVQPKSVGDIRLAFFKDPDGNELELFQSPSLTWSK
jgi:glyoxylase I family protein